MGGDCCDRSGYQTVFSDRFARRIARTYRKRGLNDTQLRMVSFLTERGIQDASVLEIGGGVGDLQIELLRRGAGMATNLEISRGYEAEAAALLQRSGMADRVSRRFVDIAASPDEVDPADVVILHRVVCCYPDYDRLLSAAANHARRLLVFSHPPRNVFTRALMRFENLLHRLRGSDFRAFVHPPAAMITVAEASGLSVNYRHRGLSWHIVGLERMAGRSGLKSKGSGNARHSHSSVIAGTPSVLPAPEKWRLDERVNIWFRAWRVEGRCGRRV